MLEFFKKFVYDGFEPGNFQNGFTHIMSVIILIVSTILLSYFLRNKDEKTILKKLKGFAIGALALYFFRRTMGITRESNLLEVYWPFYLCNINTIFVCIYTIFGFRRGREFFLVTGLIGGIVTFTVDNGIFSDRYLTLPVLDSIISHYVIIIIPVVMFATKAHVLYIKNVYKIFIGLLIVLFHSEVVQRWLFQTDHDYLFIRSNLPFTIPGVPQFYIISSLAIIFVFFVYGLDYLYIGLLNRLAIKRGKVCEQCGNLEKAPVSRP